MIVPELMNEYLYFCKYRQDFYNNKRLDLRGVEFFKPTMILPLLTFIKETGINEKDILLPDNPDVRNYFYTIYRGQMNYNDKRTYIPLTELPIDRNQVDNILNSLYTIEPIGGKEAFCLVIDELVDNIYDHSNFTHAYILGQHYPRLQYTDIGIYDNGKGIAGSLNEAGYNYNIDKHAQAILDAIYKGYSSKNMEGRGFGLNHSIKIYQEYGEILIVSCYGSVYINKDEKEPREFILTDKERLDDTLITFRVPTQLPYINIYDYVK